MAPELSAGRPASTRSDIYSLGVVLYQLLAGDFTAANHDGLGQTNYGFVAVRRRWTLLCGRSEGAVWQCRGIGEETARLACAPGRVDGKGEGRASRSPAPPRGGRGRSSSRLGLALAITLGYGMRRAEQQRQRAEAYLYDADMNLAAQALQENNVGLALSLLNLHRPSKVRQPDLRGWEWRYLWGKCQSDELATIGQHDGYVPCVTVSPDGKWVASGGYDGWLKIWRLAPQGEEGRSVTNLQLQGGPVGSVAFSPEGSLLAIGTATNGCVVLRVPGWQQEMILRNEGMAVTSVANYVAFSADGRLLAAGRSVEPEYSRSVADFAM